ncbi:hypothetical protein EIN_409340 [Entamoeba invadens IP1]|uniref:Uncharacterized protein n=1 Tax=Entamoeba invadens IP1 TaxID=370355 RepID=A0A0A1TZM6_ENTIV|nr:hypothetical protein EIN_409340 [Entamoeba invadens IP1]ELP85635.1 hypothetical protein EIN_409340 [Entamoeba invadens IP1]|eukprot:XP_004184981.1 hypothetical protein EIN_409340 [Entamoeba invadens IP1]
MNIYMFPHVLSVWSPTEYTTWDCWESMLSAVKIYLTNDQLEFVVPFYYLDMNVSENQTFIEKMNDYKLVLIPPTNDVTDIEKMMEERLTTLQQPLSLGIQFHQYTNFGFGSSTQDDITHLMELDNRLHHYSNYYGMTLLDLNAFQTFVDTNPTITSYPLFHSMYYNYFNGFDKPLFDKTILFAKTYTSILSLDISDIDTSFFTECDMFLTLLEQVQRNGMNYTLLLNRSVWLNQWLVFPRFFIRSCLSRIP